jgi:hypothetical protein
MHSTPATPHPRFDTFYRHDALTALLFDYAAAHPKLVSVASIGKSFEGRDIWVVTLTQESHRTRTTTSRRSGPTATSMRPNSRRAPPSSITCTISSPAMASTRK